MKVDFQFIDAKRVSEMTGISESSLRAYRTQKIRLPYLKLKNGRVLYLEKIVREYMAGKKPKTQRNPSKMGHYVCVNCYRKYDRYKSWDKGGRKYCSKTCRDEYRAADVDLVCGYCGEVFQRPRWYVNQNKKRGVKNVFCSKKHSMLFLRKSTRVFCLGCSEYFDGWPGQKYHNSSCESKYHARELTDKYIKGIYQAWYGFKPKDVTLKMIELKRNQMALRRVLKGAKKL